METSDGIQYDVTETVQQFLDMILEQIITGVEEKQRKDSLQVVHEIVNDMLRKAVQIAEDEKCICPTETKVTVQEHPKPQQISNDESDGRTTDYNIRDEMATETVSLESPDLTTSEYFSKSEYLDSRLSLYASLIRRPEGIEKQITDVKPSIKAMVMDYTLNASKEQQDSLEKGLKYETNAKISAVNFNDNTSNSHISASTSDVKSYADHLEDCTKRYRNLHEDSISSLRKECIDNSDANKLTDAKVSVKADLMEEKEFPKFSKVKKIKTKYGKVKIHYTEDLSKAEQDRIVKNAVEMLVQNAKQNELAESRRQRKTRGGFGTRIANFFRRLSCCRNSDKKYVF